MALCLVWVQAYSILDLVAQLLVGDELRAPLRGLGVAAKREVGGRLAHRKRRYYHRRFYRRGEIFLVFVKNGTMFEFNFPRASS
jgi:hypothetical protein